MTDTHPPFKALDPLAVFSYAVGIALREAEIDGVLTKEATIRISDRADAIKNALFDGKVVEVHANGGAVIRDAEPDEEAEMADEVQFPFHHKSKTSLDI